MPDYRGYLINPSGVLIKPKDKHHFSQLMQEETKWKIDPQTGNASQVGGFRIPEEPEIKMHLEREQAKSREMQKRELQNRKQNAQIVMMAPDETTLEKLLDARQAKREST